MVLNAMKYPILISELRPSVLISFLSGPNSFPAIQFLLPDFNFSVRNYPAVCLLGIEIWDLLFAFRSWARFRY